MNILEKKDKYASMKAQLPIFIIYSLGFIFINILLRLKLYGLVSLVLWSPIIILDNTLFKEDKLANSLVLYRSIGLSYRDLVKNRYKYIVKFIIKINLIFFSLIFILDSLRDIEISPRIDYRSIFFIVNKLMILELATLPSSFGKLLKNNKREDIGIFWMLSCLAFILFFDYKLIIIFKDKIFLKFFINIFLLILIYFFSQYISIKILESGDL